MICFINTEEIGTAEWQVRGKWKIRICRSINRIKI